jgi:transcriptional regulator with XRE-family HTH domain
VIVALAALALIATRRRRAADLHRLLRARDLCCARREESPRAMDLTPDDEIGSEQPEAQFGARLRSAREREGRSLRALARDLHRAHSSLVEYERGYRLAPVDVVREYESALGLEAGSLVALRTQAQSARAAIGRDGSLPVQRAVPPTAAAAATAATGAAAQPPAPTPDEPRRARVPLARSRLALIALAIVVLAAVGLAVGFGGLVGGGTPTRQTAAIELPPGGVVPRCWMFQGAADLRSGRTLVLGVKNLDNDDPRTYFAAVTWRDVTGTGAWFRPLYFGTVAGQHYAVTAHAMTRSAFDAVPNKDDPTTWAAVAPPPGTDALKTVQVRRRTGASPC